MSSSTSNLLPKYDTPAHRSVIDFVKTTQRTNPDATFTLDGQRGAGQSQLCRQTADGRSECVDIALEAKNLFGTMQALNFFCQLPQDPSKVHINCQRIPQ